MMDTVHGNYRKASPMNSDLSDGEIDETAVTVATVTLTEKLLPTFPEGIERQQKKAKYMVTAIAAQTKDFKNLQSKNAKEEKGQSNSMEDQISKTGLYQGRTLQEFADDYQKCKGIPGSPTRKKMRQKFFKVFKAYQQAEHLHNSHLAAIGTPNETPFVFVAADYFTDLCALTRLTYGDTNNKVNTTTICNLPLTTNTELSRVLSTTAPCNVTLGQSALSALLSRTSSIVKSRLFASKLTNAKFNFERIYDIKSMSLKPSDYNTIVDT
jgi:hypothetical protein